jgi:drug/metabolite transporter (DMT)-like permease
MTHPDTTPSPRRPPTWALVLAFGLVYLSWGTTYLAIKKGVKDERLPPALFGGVRVCLAGAVLLGYLALRGRPVGLSGRACGGAALAGLVLFVGGNGLITAAERTVPSGVAAVLAASTPLWIGLLAMLWPRGERLGGRGWLGLVLGLGGVLLLLAPRLHGANSFVADWGPLMVLGSACSWALGSLIVRHRRSDGSHLTAAAYQMLLGGGGLAVVGLALGEADELTPDRLTVGAACAFFYLLIVGSLVGFVAYNWLLGHVPAAQVGTYAYVNPLVAILVGCLDGEELTGGIVAGMAVILAGVALVRRDHTFASRGSGEARTDAGSDGPTGPRAPTTAKRSADRVLRGAR